MVFSSLIFLYAFLPLSLIVYSLCKSIRAKNIALLVFSLIFYAWGEPVYVLLLMFMALCSWFCALRVEYSETEKAAKLWVAVSVVIDLVLIGFFKYAGMFFSLFGEIPEFVSRIALPIGISFYTFQLMTYVIDVYREDAEARESYLDVLLYAALFHQCIAGPIVRFKTISRELYVKRNTKDLLPGIARFAVGLAKKTLLANPCGALADSILLTKGSLDGMTVLASWLGALAYTLQIYLDFSAYSDMAIGMGKMIGLHYMENFKYPYISGSVTEFWRRWHISLSTFFRDYVYIPLGGNRCSTPRMLFNMFVVWALTGLWHGASWNFVAWGLYYYIFLVMEKLFLKKALDKTKIISHIYLLLIVMFGWILFYYTDIRDAFTVVKNMFGANGNAFSDFSSLTFLRNNYVLIAVSCICSTPLLKILAEKAGDALCAGKAGAVLWDVLSYMLVPIIFLILSTASLVGDSYNPFIYFRF